MKAAIYTQYGDPSVVTIEEVPDPIPKKGELLVRVVASAVTAGDARIRAARFPKGFGFLAKLAFGISKPRRPTLGMTYSGVVTALGDGVGSFAVGDEVCGMTGIRMGAHAEYVCVKQGGSIVKKPKSVSHQDAAGMLFGGTAALYFLRDKAKVQPGEKVLINGASGAVGTNAVQLAKLLGADVTGVTSGDNVQLVQSLGASEVIDYTKQSVFDEHETFDVVLDAVGNITIEQGLKLLTPKGRLILMAASLGQIIKSNTNKKVLTGTASEHTDDITYLLSLVEQEKLRVVVDAVYPLKNIAKAHVHVDGGNKKGNVVIAIGVF